MTNVYIDSDVIVASEIEEEENHKKSKKFMNYVIQNENSGFIFFTSIFTFLELASAIIRRTQDENKAYSLLYRIKTSWKKSINPITPIHSKKTSSFKSFFTELVDTLIETSIKFRTPSGDTFHAHTVAEIDINYLITWNKKHFGTMEKQIKNLKILTPLEFLDELENKTQTLIQNLIKEGFIIENEAIEAIHDNISKVNYFDLLRETEKIKDKVIGLKNVNAILRKKRK